MMTIKLIPYDIKNSAITAASSVVVFDDQLFLCCDDQYALFELDSKNIWHQHIWSEALALPLKLEERKKVKPDYEVLMKSLSEPSCLMLFPSGSKDNRTLGLEYNLVKKSFRTLDLKPLFNSFKSWDHLINIEGGALLNDHYLFLNRGIGEHLSSLLVVDPKTFACLSIHLLDFGKIADCCLHGSELFLYDGYLYALAVAEKSANSYDDGEIVGSGLFKLSLKNFEIQEAWHFDRPIKAEGLCRFREHWLVVTDPDGGGLSEFFFFSLPT